jgi:hypothetical protein
LYTSAHYRSQRLLPEGGRPSPYDMAFSNPTLSALVIVSLLLAIAALGLVLAPGALRLRRLNARRVAPTDKALQGVVDTQARAIERLEGTVRQLAQDGKRLGEITEETLRHVAVVRFDAFEDMGGRLSFSAALLDGHGNGVVITSINGRQDTRCYAKQIRGSTSIHNLSDEERQAIREAMSAPRQIVEAS